jgi:hypothetical protein
MAQVWRDKTDVHNPQVEGNSWHEGRNCIKQCIVEDQQKWHMVMWTQGRWSQTAIPSVITHGNGGRFFFHLSDLTSLNSFILFSSCCNPKFHERH